MSEDLFADHGDIRLSRRYFSETDGGTGRYQKDTYVGTMEHAAFGTGFSRFVNWEGPDGEIWDFYSRGTGLQGDQSGSRPSGGATWEGRMTPNAPAVLDNPWVGEPGNEDDLERARNLRRALSYAIDRDSINEFILFGQGCHQYVYVIDTCNPRHQDKWIHPYDVEKARELMAMGGYPDGFELPLWIPTATPPDTFIEVAEAIVPMWEELGITVTIDKSAYSSRRPEFFERGALKDVFAFPWGGDIELVQYTDYLCDLIDGCTRWNSGYDDPIGYDVHKNFSASYRDPDEAWNALIPYFEYHSYLGDLPVVTSLDWLDPMIVGPRIGDVAMVEHNLAMPEIEGIHIADQ